MRRKIISRKLYMKTVCMGLAILMMMSMMIFDIGGVTDSPDALAAPSQLLPGITLQNKVSDLDTSNFMFLSEFDAQSVPNYQFVNTSTNDGRIWTDKSVNASQAFIYDSIGGVVGIETTPVTGPEFLVTYSALSQTVNTTSIIVEPSDTVIVLDVSGSMASNTVPGDGRSRIAVVIDALNDAIRMLMGANENNRVSVVIFGGQSVSGSNYAKAQPILALGRYNTTAPIFTVSGTTVSVASGSNLPGTPAPAHSSFTVEGGTPTQLGMRRGAQVLLGVPQGLAGGNGTLFDTGTPDPSGSGNIIVTRQPNIILMTDGEPTYAWTDYRLDGLATIDGNNFTYNVGNGSTGDMGLTALTVMTASYVKELVRSWYYGSDTSRNVGFYNIGLGVNSAIANGMLDPYGISPSGVPNAQLVVQNSISMLDVLNSFIPPGSTTMQFPAINKGASTSNPPRTNYQVTNNGGVVTCNYDTMAFTAMDKQGLDDAFNTITQQIVNQGNYSTNVGSGDPQFSGYLGFSDVLGEYMEFSSFRGLYYNNAKYNGSEFAAAITNPANAALRNSFLAGLVRQMTQTAQANSGFNLAAATDLFNSNLAAGAMGGLYYASAANFGNIISYYADGNRGYLGSCYDAAGNFVPAPAPAPGGTVARVDMYIVQDSNAVDSETGDPTDLMYIIFQRVTALTDGIYTSADSAAGGPNLSPTLKAGDQIVRWYIPAALIPLRSVEPVMNGDVPAKDDFGNQIYQVAESVPLRVIFSVTPNLTAISGGVFGGTKGLSAQYMSVNKAPGENSYYFYSNRWRGVTGYTTRADLANMTFAHFIPADTNQYYAPGGPGSGTMLGVPKQPIPVGLTGTAPFAWDFTHFTVNPTVQVQRLGNNGRLQIQSQATIQINKTFDFIGAPPPGSELTYPSDNISSISFNLWGRDMDGNLIYFSNIPIGSFSGAGTGPYTLAVNVPPGQYVIQEVGGIPLIMGWSTTVNGSGPISPEPPPITPIISADSNVTVNIDNIYEYNPIFISGGTLYLYKFLHGLFPGSIDPPIPSNYPDYVNLTITGPDSLLPGDPDYKEVVVTLDGSNNWRTAVDIEHWVEGMYELTESNADVDGFTLESNLPIQFEISQDAIDNTSMRFVADNTYTEIPDPVYSLNISKTLSGLTGTDAAGNPSVPQGLVFKVAGVPETATAGYLQSIRWEDLLATMPLTGLIPGQYTITEVGGSADGFYDPSVSLTMDGAALQNGGTFTLPGASGDISFNFTNTYRPMEPPPPPESLVVRKLLSFPAGTTDAQRQQSLQQLRNQNFAIVVTGPYNFNEIIYLDRAIAGAVFEDVASGNYVFNEINAALPGYNFTSNPALPFTRNIQPDTTDAVTVEISNIYSTTPPAEQSPQTGVTRSVIIPIVLIAFGAICVIGAEMLRRRFRIAKK